MILAADGIRRLLRHVASTSSILVLRSSMAVITIGVAVKALALVKEMAVASAFGASAAIDGYLLALAVPSFALTIFSTSFATALVPAILAMRREETGDDAAEFAGLAVGCCIAGAAVLTLILAVAGRPILEVVAFGFEPERHGLALEFYYALLAVFFFGTIKETLAAVLTASRRFAAPAVSPAVTILITLGFIFVLGADWGVLALVAGTSLGFACEAAFIAVILARSSLPFMPRWRGMLPRLRPLLAETRHLVLGAVLMGGASVVDLAMATTLASGEVAILSYGTRLTAVVVTLLAATATVCLPYFSALASAGDRSGLRRMLLELSAWTVLLTVPVVLLLGGFSEALIRILFEGGSFTGADTVAAARVQTMFALQVPFYVLTIIAMRVITALGRNDVVALISLLFLVADVAGNLMLVSAMGAAGIALATSVAYAVSAAAALGYLLYPAAK